MFPEKNTEFGNTSACYAFPMMTKQMNSSLVYDRTVTQHPLSLSKQPLCTDLNRIHHRRNLNGQEMLGEMFSILTQQGNANQNYSESPHFTCQNS